MLTDDSGLDSLSESLVRRRSYMKAGFIFVHDEVSRIAKRLMGQNFDKVKYSHRRVLRPTERSATWPGI